MKRTNILKAIDDADEVLVSRADDFINGKKQKKHFGWKQWTAIAACLALMICAVPIIKIVFGRANNGNPVFIQYESFDELRTIVGDGLLFDNLESTDASEVSLQLDYNRGADGVSPDGKPWALHVIQKFSYNDNSDRVHLYIFFNRENTDSIIAGYEEQGLTKTINGVTIQYSMIEFPEKTAQAKFLYKGNLYILNVDSSGTEWQLDRYLNRLFGITE